MNKRGTFIYIFLLGLLVGLPFIFSRVSSEGLTKPAISKVVPDEKIKILLVPGHEPDYGGTVYRGLNEREVVVNLAGKLKKILEQNGNYEVLVARDNESFAPYLQEYFEDREPVDAWRAYKERETATEIEEGIFEDISGISHNKTSDEAAHHLYAINKWVNENNVDVVLHLHVNDDVRKNRKIPGKHSGFALYVPEKQYQNTTSSKILAASLKQSLIKSFSPSTLKIEENVIIESQKLIALGRYNTLDVTAVLIEYGYIYDELFNEQNIESTLETIVGRTFEGIEEFRFAQYP